jgi:hypothetical protein
MDADEYMAEHPIPEDSLEGIKIHAKAYRRRYGLCVNAAGWPSPFLDGEIDPAATLPLEMEERVRRVREKWKASGKGDLQWLEAYVAEKLASIHKQFKY